MMPLSPSSDDSSSTSPTSVAGGGGGADFKRESLVLADILRNRTMLHLFQKFLEQEYSEENLFFYLEAEAFRVLSDQQTLQSKALQLYDQYIDPTSAPHLINLTQETVAQIQLTLEPLMPARRRAPSVSSLPLLTPTSPTVEESSAPAAAAAAAADTGKPKKSSRYYDTLSVRLKKSLAISIQGDVESSSASVVITSDLFDQAAKGVCACGIDLFFFFFFFFFFWISLMARFTSPARRLFFHSTPYPFFFFSTE